MWKGLILVFLLQVLHRALSDDILTAKDELQLTSEQIKGFKKFKAEVQDLTLTNYMKTDMWLVKYFRLAKFDADTATRIFKETLKFRVEYSIDKILDEKFSYAKTLPVNIERTDRKGRPIMVGRAEKYDLFPLLAANEGRNVRRYIYQVNEKLATRIISQFEKEGKISRFIGILDLHNSHNSAFMCPPCMAWFKDTMVDLEAHYPSVAYRLVIINFPPFATSVLEACKGLMNEDTRTALAVFGPEPDKWRPYLAELLEGEGNIPEELNVVDSSDMGAEGSPFNKPPSFPFQG